MLNKIVVRGARVHNLKNVDIDVPHNKLVVFTGLSGSGKSSLAFDTIYAEGQRRFMESISSFAKQFMEIMDKPDVDQIDGLPPTIAIDQRSLTGSPRSTVGTVTEIYDYLRLLYSRIGVPHCPNCGQVIEKMTIQQIINQVNNIIKTKPEQMIFLAPVIKNEKINISKKADEIQTAGYFEVRLDKLFYGIQELRQLKINEQGNHSLDIVCAKIDKSQIKFFSQTKLVQIIKSALDLGNGVMTILIPDKKDEVVLTQNLICSKCDVTIPELEPSNFSFNSPAGACKACTGLGYLLKFDPLLLIPNKKLTIAQGAIQPLTKIYTNNTRYIQMIDKEAKKYKFDINTAIQDLDEKQFNFLMNGDGKKVKIDKNKDEEEIFSGIIPYLEDKYKDTDSEYLQNELEEYMRIFICPDCNGKRLKPSMLSVTIADKSIDWVVNLSLNKLHDFFEKLIGIQKDKKITLSENELMISRPIVNEMIKRLAVLKKVGLSYLVLDRSMATLSGGEAQRIKLSNQISSSLVGIVYVLDEPSIGLHPKNTEEMIETLKGLRDSGNTVLVVEHDKNIIMAADEVVDVGPGAGKNGGEIIACGTVADIIKNKKSLTGKYLSGDMEIPLKKNLHKGSGKFIEIKGASEFNLKNIDVKIPLGKLICVTGVSGSGKSTLVIDILNKSLAKKFYKTKEEPGKHKDILGLENIDKIIAIDQSPIGRTPRSNPATYTNVFTPIRELFTQLPESIIKGFKPGHFSFNVKGGRCETCQGEGMVKIDMRFLSDVYVECKDCHGKRYNKEALEVFYEGKSIADVLAMTVDEAMTFFSRVSAIHDKLKTLSDVGLGYVQLGQPANTLSGGEAQRIKLSAELSRRSTGKTLYILDEPTTGLHFEDIKRLLNILNQLADKGNTVIIIEHNLDVIKTADWVIDLGPEGGDEGGYLVAEGTPQDIVKSEKSITGKYLKELL